MAISNFIPTVWSENLYRALDKQYIGVANCNREYEGEIKNCGSVVKICGVGAVTVSDYTKNTDMSNPQALSDTVKELSINQAKYFNFQIDDIDRAQCTPKLMDAATDCFVTSFSQEQISALVPPQGWQTPPTATYIHSTPAPAPPSRWTASPPPRSWTPSLRQEKSCTPET